MQREFSKVWRDIQENLKAGMEIDYWGMARGYSMEKFKINSVSYELIVCDPPKAENLQPVPRKDFMEIWKLWIDYLNGEVQRKYIRDEVSRYSSYVISIIHHVQKIAKDG